MPTISETNWTGLLVGTDGEDYRLLSSGAYLSGPYNHHIPDADTLMYWRMDEASWNGTAGEIIDRSGRDNHGQAKYGFNTTSALMDRGGDSSVHTRQAYIWGPAADEWRTTQQLTVSGWVYIRSWFLAAGSEAGIFTQLAHPASWSTPYFLWRVCLSITGQICFQVYTTSMAWVSGALSLDTWHHLAMTWDGTTVTGYVDGTALSTVSSGTPYYGDKGPIHISNDQGDVGSKWSVGWNCMVDEFCMSKAVRTIDPGLYASRFVRCSPLDAGVPVSWRTVNVQAPQPVSSETWGLYVQATESPDVPAQTDPAWQQAAIGQAGNATLDLSALGLQGRYLHRMWFLNPSLDAKKWHQASIGACEWSYAPVVSGRRSTQWRRYGPILIPTGVM